MADMARGTFLRLFASGNAPLIAAAVTSAIEHSYAVCPMRQRTEAENKRRFELCAEIYETLVESPYVWATTRIIEHLPRFLVERLEKRDWKPKPGGMWNPAALASFDPNT